ncbi:MAG: alpha/beta hydrolase [Sphingomonas sp.]
MRHLAPAMLAVLLVGGCGHPSAPPGDRREEKAPNELPVLPVKLKARDGVTVFGRYYRVAHPKALILLFHQAGSSKDEYASIAPQLNREGYSALAIDQRSGGGLYGPNETAALIPPQKGRSEDAGYPTAEPDLQAALDWGVRQKLPLILWGSSYSAALVFDVVAQNPGKVKALLAFSPGEYMPDKHFVDRAARVLTIPVFVTSSSDPEEIAGAGAIAAAVPGGRAAHIVPVAGVHGSSTLIAVKNPNGADANWQAVLAFLKKIAP